MWHFHCTFRTCIENSSNKNLHLRKLTVLKDTHYAQERTFPWHASATCPKFATIRLVRYRPRHVTFLGPYYTKAKHGEKYGFGVISVPLHKVPPKKMISVIQLQAKSRIIHELLSFHEPLVQQPESALLCLEHCSVAFSLSHAALCFLMNTHQESKTHPK